jgi:hypothetical protein
MQNLTVAASLVCLLVVCGSPAPTTQDACAQASTFPISIDARALFSHHSVQFGDQWSGIKDQTRLELNLLALLGEHWRFRYSFNPGWNFEDHALNANSFVVNGIEFRETQKEKQGKKGDPKPILLSWQHGADNRMELTAIVNSPVRPMIIGEWVGVSLTATGEKEGKPIEATESFRAFLWAIGGNFQVRGDRWLGDLTACAGDRLVRAECILVYRVAPGWSMLGGYEYEAWKVGELRVKCGAPVLGLWCDW